MGCLCKDPKANFFIAAVFNQCQVNTLHIVSFVFGWLSIFCWIVALYPQIRVNFLIKETEAISLIFIIQWIGGDICSAVSTTVLKLLFTQQFLALFYCAIDVVLIFQLVYYRLPLAKKLREKRMSTKVGFAEGQFYAFMVSMVVIGICCYGVPAGNLMQHAPNQYPQCQDNVPVTGGIYYFGLVLSYLTIPLYGLSKPGQIYKNYKRKCTEGLASGMFLCTFSGNVFQFISLMCDIANGASALDQAPFIFSCTWPALCDLIILWQVWYYGRQGLSQDNKLNDDVTETNMETVTTEEINVHE
ncbi:Seven transmembrane protein 1 [Spironucleus salmonicida]|uniref:PQ-loop motif-containing protein n=1 Tax=Spironucleus salmonicida TaxID=348837 RepID=V6LNW0_9EUKA|nr:Seven transmembrane protein 1 [Spironucleus salmonicida]|eukprot:EST42419.1 PQ-loop motif-containing protein [Spironucleus salmonicida]